MCIRFACPIPHTKWQEGANMKTSSEVRAKRARTGVHFVTWYVACPRSSFLSWGQGHPAPRSIVACLSPFSPLSLQPSFLRAHILESASSALPSPRRGHTLSVMVPLRSRLLPSLFWELMTDSPLSLEPAFTHARPRPPFWPQLILDAALRPLSFPPVDSIELYPPALMLWARPGGVPSGQKKQSPALIPYSTSLDSHVGSQIWELMTFSTLNGFTSGFTEERNPIVLFR